MVLDMGGPSCRAGGNVGTAGAPTDICVIGKVLKHCLQGQDLSLTFLSCPLCLVLKSQALISAVNFSPVSIILFMCVFCALLLQILVYLCEIFTHLTNVLILLQLSNVVQQIIFPSPWQSLQQPTLKQQQGSVC